MSISISAPATRTAVKALRPTFFGITRGELFKIRKQWSVWIMGLILAGIICLPYLVTIASPVRIKGFLETAPLQAFYRELGTNLVVLRVFSGALLIIITARLVGMEYSSGTIRILLGRGVGRLQLLGAKLLASFIVGFIVLIAGLALNVVLSLISLTAIMGNLDSLKALNSGFWQDTLVFIGTVAIGLAVPILMAATLAVIGRSLAFGVSAGIIFFPADNIGIIFFLLAEKLTNATGWGVATGDLLGPNLNAMPQAFLPARAAEAVGFAFQTPLVPVDGGHTLLVTGVWTAIFVVTMVVLTWKRDVTQ
jgi:ABC-type transport system involved in multi-copper enzyme maturation permease subunit